MSTKLGDITLTKQTGTRVTLSSEGTYFPDNKYFDISVQNGAGTVTVASTDASVEPDLSGRNISNIIGIKDTSAPQSGYYLKINATGDANSTITSPGWLGAGSLGTATATGSYYFPVDSATVSIAGTNTITPSTSLSGTNVSFSNTNNGISVTSTGGGSASTFVSVTSTGAGYVPDNSQIASDTVGSTSESTSASLYISGVTLQTPTSGLNSFSITVPNENSTITFVFNVDSNGNVTVTDS